MLSENLNIRENLESFSNMLVDRISDLEFQKEKAKINNDFVWFNDDATPTYKCLESEKLIKYNRELLAEAGARLDKISKAQYVW